MLTESQALALVHEAFAALGMTQSGYEARDFAVFISERDISNICELGTCAGGLMWLMDRAAKPGLRLSLDMPWGERDPKLPDNWEQRFHEHLPHVIEFLGNIHDQAQRQKLAECLNGRKLDLLMIDADHSYEGGRKHWEMYSEFVRPGGFVAFHDVRNGWSVGRFYDELCRRYAHYEFCEQDNLFGIGVIAL
jgi:predicted O-methyltransferase YrrM